MGTNRQWRARRGIEWATCTTPSPLVSRQDAPLYEAQENNNPHSMRLLAVARSVDWRDGSYLRRRKTRQGVLSIREKTEWWPPTFQCHFVFILIHSRFRCVVKLQTKENESVLIHITVFSDFSCVSQDFSIEHDFYVPQNPQIWQNLKQDLFAGAVFSLGDFMWERWSNRRLAGLQRLSISFTKLK